MWRQYVARTKRVKLRPPSGQNPLPWRWTLHTQGGFHFKAGSVGLFLALSGRLFKHATANICLACTPSVLVESRASAANRSHTSCAVPDTFTTLCRNWQAVSWRVGKKALDVRLARPLAGQFGVYSRLGF